MGCADYRLYCDGDSDGDGNDLLYGVLDEKSVLELFQGALALIPFLARFFLPCTDHQGRMKARKSSPKESERTIMGLKRVEEIKFFQNPFSILKIMCIFVIQIKTYRT